MKPPAPKHRSRIAINQSRRQAASVRGFTLIELLVVIALIGLLTTLSLITLRNKQRDARDAKRRADIATTQSALTVYHWKKTPIHLMAVKILVGILSV